MLFKLRFIVCLMKRIHFIKYIYMRFIPYIAIQPKTKYRYDFWSISPTHPNEQTMIFEICWYSCDSWREQSGLSVMDIPASLASSSLGIPLILLCLTEEHFLFSCVWALNFTQFRMLSTIPQFVAYNGTNQSDITTT